MFIDALKTPSSKDLISNEFTFLNSGELIDSIKTNPIKIRIMENIRTLDLINFLMIIVLYYFFPDTQSKL